MSKKIEIQKSILEDLYLKQKFSTYKIAKMFKCNPSIIQKRLRENRIELRSPKQKIEIQKEKLFDFYINKRLSTQKISKILKISSSCVYYKMSEAGIKTRQKRIVKISRKKLRRLYHDRNLSCSEIGKKFDCDKITIFNKMKEYGIKRRNLSQANTIYSKKKFDGDNILKAYLIGFRLGDLNVKAKNGNSTIMVKSNTTKKEQFQLIKKIYGKYGHFKGYFNGKIYSTYCNLDSSFNFLLKKEDNVEDWILNNNKCFFSFLAGYTDAEGNISVSQGRARFRIRTYDKNILFQIYNKLNSLNINTIFNLASKAGVLHNRKQNKDCWGVFVSSKEALSKLFEFIKPYMKHKKRRNDLILAEKNVLERNKKHR